MKNKYTFRSFMNDLHLYAGIASGLVLFLVCLSGTLYTFRSEVEIFLEPEKYEVQQSGTALPINSLIDKVETEAKGKVVNLETSADQSGSWQFRVVSNPKDRRGTIYFVNPYSGKVLGTSEGPATAFFMFLFKLHRWLLMDNAGKIIVGSSTIIFVFLILSGLVLWFPKKIKNWKQGFKIKTSGNWKRLNHDLHNTLGFYTFSLLLIMSLTGLCWSFEWYKDSLGKVLGVKIFDRGGKPKTVDQPENTEVLSYEELLAKTNLLLPYDGDCSIAIPREKNSAIAVRKHKPHGFFTLAAADKLLLNPYTGEAIEVDKFSDKPINQQIGESIRFIHTGEIFGLFSKILYFISCLIATSLPITGTIIWINKLRKKKKNKRHVEQKIVGRIPKPAVDMAS